MRSRLITRIGHFTSLNELVIVVDEEEETLTFQRLIEGHHRASPEEFGNCPRRSENCSKKVNGGSQTWY
jgi:hypothetical protein